ncbi:Acetyltransferase (GNAT) domain-containing protein [Pseudosulfitobacter pseudonitzschiae]|uniref:GNAT family N-acetyltransferase n=1 Tax=Pseudosulfitobacter pseudonitzschiae TaxID=1402135 RepID=UPI000921D676|nr:GNAT family N-acetyltransferase [Pseudosulfitobacter pseudonitzschiae]QKS10345.1 GNAT family N-acetyltransferase [Pseudosulfitobacter pseudonitzschiae]SHF54842.1 Acetyltransferase (GNAT) domain-containing protein [Pseudosulfitobacter pseudonitzschiae]
MTSTKPLKTPLSQANITFEPFTQGHLADGLRMSQAVQWPHRAEDWALSLSVSNGVVAMADGQVVGTALCSSFGAVATMNMIIVDADMRGCGLGRGLMERVIALGGARELRLVATADGLPLYEKLGFQATGRILQHQGIARPTTPDLPVATGMTDDIARLAQMDTAASGMSRDALLATIAAGGEILTHQNGFAMLRSFGRGKVVGPIVAKDAATARALLTEAANRCAGQFLRVDLVEEHGLAGHAQDLGLDHTGTGIAMRRAQAPLPARSTDFKTYALVSQALG